MSSGWKPLFEIFPLNLSLLLFLTTTFHSSCFLLSLYFSAIFSFLFFIQIYRRFLFSFSFSFLLTFHAFLILLEILIHSKKAVIIRFLKYSNLFLASCPFIFRVPFITRAHHTLLLFNTLGQIFIYLLKHPAKSSQPVPVSVLQEAI